MKTEICIPASVLAIPDGEASQAMPEMGEPVEFTAGGTVSRIEGDKAYIMVDTANGEPLPAMPEMDMESDEALESAAMAEMSRERVMY